MLFNIGCSHDWQTLIKVTKQKCHFRFNSSFTCSEKLFEEMLYGTQKVVFSCKKCGKIIEKEYIGEVNER